MSIVDDEASKTNANRKGKRRRRVFSPFHALFRDPKRDYKIIRACIALPFGLIVGILLYWTTIRHTSIDESSKRIVGYAVIISVSLGFTVSRQIRCVICLIGPVMVGKHGRTLLAAYAMSLLIEGPIKNTIHNFGDMARSSGCLAKMRFNMTVEKLKLKFEPLWEIIKQLEMVGEKSKDAVKNQKSEWLPVKKEIGDNSQVVKTKEETEETDRKLHVEESRVEMIKKKIQSMNRDMMGGEALANWTEKNAFRCEDIYNRAVKECLNALENAHQKCKDKFNIISGLVCWGFTQSSTCNRLDGRKAIEKCISSQGSPEGMGEGYETMDQATNEFAKEFEYSLTAKLAPFRENIDDVTPVEVAKILEQEFTVRKKMLAFSVSLMHHFISFMFLLVFRNCQTYVNKYLKQIDYDNNYITPYFRTIDDRRKAEGKMTLLPVKKVEEKEICDPLRLSFSKVEVKRLAPIVTPVILQVVAATIILGFDYLTWQTLDMLKRLGRMEFTQKGVHIVRLTVFGKGFMADLMRDIIRNLSVEKYIDQVHSNSRCLPSPTKTSPWNVLRVYLVYFFVFALIYVELYVIRTRPILCGFFFPKRQKKRVIFFYNQRLKYRKNYIRHAIAYIKKRAEKERSKQKPWIRDSLLGRFGLGCLKTLLENNRRRCYVCDQKVVVKKEWKVIECSNPECPIVYCASCWRELGRLCHACNDDGRYDSQDTAQ